jgi:hypothetical protein
MLIILYYTDLYCTDLRHCTTARAWTDGGEVLLVR